MPVLLRTGNWSPPPVSHAQLTVPTLEHNRHLNNKLTALRRHRQTTPIDVRPTSRPTRSLPPPPALLEFVRVGVYDQGDKGTAQS